MTLDLESVEKAQLEEMLPDIGFIDKFLQDLLPQENVHALDLIEDVKRRLGIESKTFFRLSVGKY